MTLSLFLPIYFSPILAAEPALLSPPLGCLTPLQPILPPRPAPTHSSLPSSSRGCPGGYSHLSITDSCSPILHPQSSVMEIQCYETWNQHFTDVIIFLCVCQRAQSNIMSNLPTIITFPFPAEHSEAFLLSSYRTAVEIVLVSGGQICRFIPNHCKPHTHASPTQTAHCYAKQVNGSFWGALFAISFTAAGLWCTGLELPTAPIAACCLNEFYISRQMKHSTKWKEFRMLRLPMIRMCFDFCKKDCGYQHIWLQVI